MFKGQKNTLVGVLPPYEYELILAYLLNKSREYVLTHPEVKLSPSQRKKLNSLINRRKNGEPLAYILGRKEFYGLDFIVDKNVLVPRPETELMVDEALTTVYDAHSTHSKNQLKLIDIGTGSGCIIITLAKLLKEKKLHSKIKFIASDISKAAIKIAKNNARLNGVSKNIRFTVGHLLEPIFKNKLLIDDCKLIIVSNLPYLTPRQVKASPSIKDEPKLALEAGTDGLKYYRQLFGQINILKNASITIFCEIDPSQKLTIRRLAKKTLSEARIEIKKDLRGHSRLAVIKINRS